MKIKRLDKDVELGGGGGRTTYKSECFTVTQWRLTNGFEENFKTSIGIVGVGIKIEFLGHHDFSSDNQCLEQFTIIEILAWQEEVKHAAYLLGVKASQHEMRKALGFE